MLMCGVVKKSFNFLQVTFSASFVLPTYLGFRVFIFPRTVKLDCECDLSCRSEFDGIAQQVNEHLSQVLLICHNILRHP